MRRNRLLILLVTLFILPFVATPAQESEEPPHRWNSHAEVARRVQATFSEIESYTADFRITTIEGNRSRTMQGKSFFQKPGRVRFEFSNPSGDLIISDGQMLWIYINRLRTVGRQDLQLETTNQDGRQIFMSNPGEGLSRLFRRYHYRFDGVEQPRREAGRDYFVLDLSQRERIGGYENIKLFIDAESYLVRRAIATDGYGKRTTIEFSNITLNPNLEGRLFQYRPSDQVRVVTNPLVTED